MGVGKGWIDLDSAGIALEGTGNVLQLLQSVPHVAVGISKVRVDPEEGGGGEGREGEDPRLLVFITQGLLYLMASL